jgi:hypothetical protein
MSEPHLCKQGTPQEGWVDKDGRGCGRSITNPCSPHPKKSSWKYGVTIVAK